MFYNFKICNSLKGRFSTYRPKYLFKIVEGRMIMVYLLKNYVKAPLWYTNTWGESESRNGDCELSVNLLKMLFNLVYLHSSGIRLQWSIRKLWQIFSNKRHWSRDGKIDIDFFDFLGVFHRFSIIKKIEVHFVHCLVCIGDWQTTGRV